jgi:hypothetical protein
VSIGFNCPNLEQLTIDPHFEVDDIACILQYLHKLVDLDIGHYQRILAYSNLAGFVHSNLRKISVGGLMNCGHLVELLSCCSSIYNVKIAGNLRPRSVQELLVSTPSLRILNVNFPLITDELVFKKFASHLEYFNCVSDKEE